METDWSFARRPFWLFSHLFAATVVVSFVLLGFWQLSRHQQRADLNAVIEARSAPPAAVAGDVIDGSPSELDYLLVEATGSFVDGDVVRVANRSQGGVAGEHLVGLFQLIDGRHLLVNRGFVPLDDSIEPEPAPAGTVVIHGWLRESVERGWLGAADPGDREVVPRLDIEAIGNQVEVPLAPVWLQEGSPDAEPGAASGASPADRSTRAAFPDPVPLPTLGGGPHLSYMGQWWVFAVLGVVFYGALLRRNARRAPETTPTPV